MWGIYRVTEHIEPAEPELSGQEYFKMVGGKVKLKKLPCFAQVVCFC